MSCGIWVAPLVQARGVTHAIGTPAHTWQMTAQGKTPAAHKGMTHVAKVMAAAAVDLLNQPDTLRRAKEEFANAREARPFTASMFDDVKPPVEMSDSL